MGNYGILIKTMVILYARQETLPPRAVAEAAYTRSRWVKVQVNRFVGLELL